jgi:hypothetical protein
LNATYTFLSNEIDEYSYYSRDLPLIDSATLTLNKTICTNAVTSTSNHNRKNRSNHRRSRGVSTTTTHDNKPMIFYYPFHHQHHNVSNAVGCNPRTQSTSNHHHHHHHHHPLHFNRGNLSHLALCSKNIYNYESVLNICKLQSLHFSIDRSLSLPNLYSPIIAGRKRHRSVTIAGHDDETVRKTFYEQIYRDICKLVRVLRILPFLLLCISVTMITIFYDATWTFLIDYMNKNDLSAQKGPHIILGVGIVAIFGEIGYGYMGDSKR